MKSPHDHIADVQQALWRQFPALRPKAPKAIPEAGRLILGRDKDGIPFPLDSRLLSAHLDMIGGTGGGKSTAMRHLAWLNMETDIALNRATIIIDPHGLHPDSLFRTTMRHIIKTELYKTRRVFIIDPNGEFCTGLKLLQSEAEPSVMADHMIEAFERLQGDHSFDIKTLRRALHGLLAVLSQLGWSLAEADLLLDPDDPHGLREWALHQITDRYAKKALLRLHYLAADPRLRREYEIETIGTENRLAPLLSSRAMRAIVGHQTLDMRDVLDGGAVLLVNTAGHNAVYETAGDLLGKLVMRSVLFAAKRRRTDSLALVFADECARYVSQDWERALAELRKYRVGIVSARQTSAMLGEPGDPVREAIEKIPATKIAFRLNSMQEAAALAPDLMQLNLEMPVEVLTKPTVVGHKRVWLDNESKGINAGTTTGTSVGTTTSTSIEEGESFSTTHGEEHSNTRSHSRTTSQSETEGEDWSESDSTGESWSNSHSEAESLGTSDSTSKNDGYSSGRSGSAGATQSGSAGTSSSRSYDRENLPENCILRSPLPTGGSESRNTSAGSGRSSERGWNEQDSKGRSTSDSTDRAASSSDTDSHGGSWSHSETHGGSHSRTVGWAETEGESESHGTSTARTEGKSVSRGTAIGSTNSVNKGVSFGTSSSTGRSEALEPILKKLPGAVHSLDNVRHMAAEMLCSLPTGVAVVRTIKDGKLEGAVVRVPYRTCPPVSDEQYASDLRTLVTHSGAGKPMRDAVREIDERERKLIDRASSMKVVHNSEEFRLTGIKRRKRTHTATPKVARKPNGGEHEGAKS